MFFPTSSLLLVGYLFGRIQYASERDLLKSYENNEKRMEYYQERFINIFSLRNRTLIESDQVKQ